MKAKIKSHQKLIKLALVGTLAATLRAQADETVDIIRTLRQQIEALEQKVRILERKQEESGKDEQAGTAKALPTITAGRSGFGFRSADTNFSLTLRGVLQVDSRTFVEDGGIKGNDSLLLRRARPILQGTVFKDFDFLFVPDFGGSTVQIIDAYLNYRFSPELQLQGGKFKSPVGLELQQNEATTFFNERTLATDLVPNRDIGFALHGGLAGGLVSYKVGVFNGAPDYSTTTANLSAQDTKAFAGRLFFQPLKNSGLDALEGFGFGLGGSYGINQAWTNTSSTGLTSGFTTDGQERFFGYTNGVVGNGNQWRISPQGYYYFGPFSLLGEYIISDQRVVNVPKGKSAGLQNTAWEITGGWVLTGEDATYAGVSPKRSFDPLNGGWGAVQLVGRYARLDVDEATFPYFADPDTAARGARAWSAGANWFLNQNVRLNTSFSRTTFQGGAGTKATVTKQPENVFFTRLQLHF